MNHVTDLMSDNCHHFIVRHNIHQSGTDADTAVTTGKSIHVDNLIYSEIHFQSVYFFDMSGQFLQAFAVFAVGCGQRIVGVHPLHVFFAHGCDVRVGQGDGFRCVATGLYHFAYIDFLSTDFELCGCCREAHSA